MPPKRPRFTKITQLFIINCNWHTNNKDLYVYFPGDPQPTVQIQVLSPNLTLQPQQQPKYQMQIPIQGFQQGKFYLNFFTVKVKIPFHIYNVLQKPTLCDWISG
jgi:hypothetical protein